MYGHEIRHDRSTSRAPRGGTSLIVFPGRRNVRREMLAFPKTCSGATLWRRPSLVLSVLCPSRMAPIVCRTGASLVRSTMCAAISLMSHEYAFVVYSWISDRCCICLGTSWSLRTHGVSQVAELCCLPRSKEMVLLQQEVADA